MIAVGTCLGPYEILSTLGAGGMGEVYRAKDTRLNRAVAIKVLPSEKVADPERKRRFVQEAKAASALNHPNIVTIYDINTDNGTDYIAMEYVSGKTLDEIIPRKGLRLNEALKYAIQMADALAKAHGAGIIHRDLKPANIMVTDEGLIKVLDFGLAKLVEPAERKARFWARWPTCPPSRRKARKWILGQISLALGRCCTRWSPARGPFRATRRCPPWQPFSIRNPSL
jgi:serine/threonine protein kinase